MTTAVVDKDANTFLGAVSWKWAIHLFAEPIPSLSFLLRHPRTACGIKVTEHMSDYVGFYSETQVSQIERRRFCGNCQRTKLIERAKPTEDRTP